MTVLLVHAAWADASHWNKVLQLRTSGIDAVGASSPSLTQSGGTPSSKEEEGRQAMGRISAKFLRTKSAEDGLFEAFREQAFSNLDDAY